jgi:hypothetical protein
MHKLLFAILLSFLFGSAKANNDSLSYKRTSYFLRASFHNGSVWAHSKRVDYSTNAPVWGFEIELLRQRIDNLDAHYNPKGFVTGFGLNFFNINNPVVKKMSTRFIPLNQTF